MPTSERLVTVADSSTVKAALQSLETSLELKQTADADLTSIAALTTTAFGIGLLDDATAAAGRTSLGLGTTDRPGFANLDIADYVYFMSDDGVHPFTIAAGNNTANLGMKWPVSLPASGTWPIMTDSLGNMSTTTQVVVGDNTLYSQDATPGTCSVGDLFVDTNATSGQRLYSCETANTWVLQGGSGTAPSDVAYDAGTWDANADAATKNAIRDKFESLSGGYTNLTSFIAQTAWRLFYSDASGDVKELALGADGEYLKSNGAALAPSWATPSGGAHDAVSLDANLGNNLLGLSTQQLTLDSQTANYVFAAPNGSAGVPSFRALVAADIPTLNQNTSGTAAGLAAQYIDWNSGSGGSSIANKPTITDDQTAVEVSFTPNGTIASSTVQLAIQEVRDEAGGGGMVYPGAGIPNSTGSAWGTSYTLDTDLSAVSASDDSLPSAKATKTALDLKANSTGISFVAGALSDMKILTTAQPSTGENLIDDTVIYGAAEDNLRLWSIDKIGSQLALKVENEAMGAAWNGDTANGAAKDNLHDWAVVFDADYDGKVQVLDLTAGLVKTDANGTVSVASTSSDYNAYDADLTTWAGVTPGTGVSTMLASAPGSAGGPTTTVASGTSALGTGAIASGACATAVTTAATGTATTDVINWGFNGDPTGVTGYAPTANGMLTIIAYPSANNVNYKVCNLTAASITPGAITLNWRVQR